MDTWSKTGGGGGGGGKPIFFEDDVKSPHCFRTKYNVLSNEVATTDPHPKCPTLKVPLLSWQFASY